MINMIKADFYRMTKSRGMLFFFIGIIATYMISIIFKEAGGVMLGMAVTAPEGMKLDVQQVGMNFTYYFLFIIPVFCIITSDFSEKTIKNTISSAISRKEYFITKFVLTEFTITVLFLGMSILFYILNALINGSEYSSSFGEFMKATMIQYPVFLGLGAVFILIAFIFRKAALFNSITIITPILYTTIALVMYGIESAKGFSEKLLKYEVNGMLNRLVMGCTDSYRNTCMVISTVAIVISFAVGYISFTKSEID